MNTTIRIAVVSNNSKEYVWQVINNAFLKFDYVVEHFSRFSDTSELSQLNKSGGSWYKASEELFFLVKFALDLAYETNGVFDPTIIDILEMYGYNKGFNHASLKGQKPDKDIQEILDNRPSYSEIQLDEKKKKIKLMPNQRIDFGAMGKGYAIDLACEVLSDKFDNFLINAGGDIRAKGRNPNGQSWKVELEYMDELNGQTRKNKLGYVKLNNESICSSGPYARKYKEFHHLIDPYLAMPSNKSLASFVIAPRAMKADAISTVSFLYGSKFDDTIVNEDIDYLVVDRDSNVHTNSGKFNVV